MKRNSKVKGNTNDKVRYPSKNDGFKKGRRRVKGTDGCDKVSSGMDTSSLNDIGWYARNPELLASAARVPFPYRPGMYLPNLNLKSVGPLPTLPNYKVAIPGVMQLTYGYSVGYSDSITSAASIAAKEMWGKIRSKFSSSLDADPPDVFMYCIALDQIHAYIAYLKRIYRTVNTWNPDNRNLPDVLLRAYHSDINGMTTAAIEDMRANMPLFWNRINTLVHMVNKFCVPKDMDLYNRHRWMNEHVYMDTPEVAAQFYVFVPQYFYFVSDDSETGTKLTPNRLPVPFTVDQAYAFGKNMVDALSEWDDAYTINGYIQRAFEDSEFYRAELLLQDEKLVTAYVPEVLAQIENAEGLPLSSTNLTGLDITQDPLSNIIIHKPKIPNSAMTAVWLKDNHLLNLDGPLPSAADVTIATRMKVVIDESQSNAIIASTEIPLNYLMYVMVQDENGNSTIQWWPYAQVCHTGTLDVAKESLMGLSLRSAFNHAPMTHTLITGYESTDFPWLNGVHPNVEMRNITSISDETLKEINRVCVYSEFNCFS